MSFLTPEYEARVEASLTPETRMITTPDGAIQPFTMDHLSWLAHDQLVDAGHSSEWLIRIAHQDARDTQRPFELMFPATIAFVRDERRKRGLPCGQ